MLITLCELYLIYMPLKQSENRSEVICKRFILTNRNGKSSIVYLSILLKRNIIQKYILVAVSSKIVGHRFMKKSRVVYNRKFI